MQKFFADVIAKVLADPKVQQWIKDLLGQLITERILPLIPVAVGAAVKVAVDELVKTVPGIEGMVDQMKTTEAAVVGLENLIPGLPLIRDALKQWGINLP